MTLIKKLIHPEVKDLNGNILVRKAVRAIVLKGESILLLYTKRYNDYSFPGGGLDEGESLTTGLIRELKEETGAKGISVNKTYG